MSESRDDFEALLREVARAPSVAPGAQLAAGSEVGRYRVVARIGAGGMGEVFRAHDPELQRDVAIKLWRPAADGSSPTDEARAWMLREARAMARLSHPNVVAVHDVGALGDRIFLAMDLAEGKTLREWLREKPRSQRSILRVLVAAGRGLAAAHAAGLAHRDFKPDNVLVDAEDRVRVADFGLARWMDRPHAEPAAAGTPSAAPLTRVGAVLGTPGYIAPEQLKGHAGPLSDQFAFAVTLYEALAGTRPFPDDDAAFLDAVRSGALRAPAAGRRVPGWLRRALARALRERPETRYPDLGALLAHLEAHPRNRAIGAVGLALLVAFAGVALATRTLAPRRAAARPTQRRLTANSRENPVWDASLSPDGKQLVYALGSGLRLEGTARPPTLPDGRAADAAAWFPDGRALAVTAHRPGEARRSLWRLDVTGGGVQLLAEDVRGKAAVSPDGREVVFPAPEGIRRVAATGEPAATLVPASPGEVFGALAWSPDGRRIAFVSRDASSGRQSPASLETVGRDGEGRVALVEDSLLTQDVGQVAAAWLPNDRLVYALAEPPPADPGSNLWVIRVDPDSGKPLGHARKLSEWNGYRIGALSASADGKSLAYVRYDAQYDVFVADLLEEGKRLGELRRLTTSERDERPASWNREGKILYATDWPKDWDLRVHGLEADAHGERLFSDEAVRTGPQPLADGSAVLYWQISPSGVPALMRRALTPDATAKTLYEAPPERRDRRIPPGTVGFRCPALGAGPCVLATLGEGGLSLFRLDPVSGARAAWGRTSAARGPSGMELSADGARLAVPDRSTLHLVDLNQGTQLPLSAPADCAFVHASFIVSGPRLVASASCDGGHLSRLYSLDEHGEPLQLFESRSQWIAEVVASPDGAHVALGVQEFAASAWRVDGL